MADAKISDLTDGVTPQDTDMSPWARAGANVKLTWLQLKSALSPITLAAGTIVASSSNLITQTWNNAAVTFNAFKVNITDTASNAASTLIDLQIAGSSKFSVTRVGTAAVSNAFLLSSDSTVLSSGSLRLATDVAMMRKAAKILEINSNTLGVGAGTAFRLVPQTVAQLTAAATAGDGAMAIVSDSTLAYTGANIGTAVVGGGANQAKVVVISGTWVIG